MFLNLKKNFTLLTILMFAVVFVGTSCKKDDEKTTEDYLVAHNWKWTSIKLGTTETIEICDQDDVITFHKNKEFHRDAGAQKCEPTESQEVTGTWSVSTATTPETLTINYTENTVTYKFEYKLVSVTKDKIEMSIDVPGFGTLNAILEKK